MRPRVSQFIICFRVTLWRSCLSRAKTFYSMPRSKNWKMDKTERDGKEREEKWKKKKKRADRGIREESRNLSSSGYLMPAGMNIQPGLFYVLAASLCRARTPRPRSRVNETCWKNANKSRAPWPRGVRSVHAAAAADKNIRPTQIRGSETARRIWPREPLTLRSNARTREASNEPSLLL